MESITDAPPLIIILGQTATGKSRLALKLAQHFGGEIIAADSRTVYQGMDIGTAKPTAEEQKIVRHHLLDILSPTETFSAADFQKHCNEAIADIAGRGKIPFMVGGTGLYIDAVAYNFSFRPLADSIQRRALEEMSVDQLQSLLAEKGIDLPSNSRNPRHLVRTLETDGERPLKQTLRPNTLLLGLSIDAEAHAAKLRSRIEGMLNDGLVDEVRELVRRYGWDAPGLQTPGYRDAKPYLEGRESLEAFKDRLVRNHRLFAKRQKTWFKRDPNIHWISNLNEAVDLITTFLNK